jgi:hypothetical protein
MKFPYKGLPEILHLICDVYKPENHIESCPECCNILRFYVEHECVLTFKPAPGSRAGIHFVGKFRGQRLANQLRMGSRKPEDRLMKCHRIASYRDMNKKDDKGIFY